MNIQSFQGVLLPHTSCSQNRLQIQCDDKADKVTAENYQMSDGHHIEYKKTSHILPCRPNCFNAIKLHTQTCDI